MASVKGKVVVILGASSGIGAEAAIAFAREGTKLVLGARRMDRLQEVANKCGDAARSKGVESSVMYTTCDVSERGDVEELIARAVREYGRVDAVIANAGYGFLAKIHETTEEQFDDIVRTNVKGTWYAMQAAAAFMLRQERLPGEKWRGHIIAVSSGAARRGLPLYGVYSMTKAAQLSLAEAMRVELKPQGVYVSTVHPLGTSTEFFEVASSKSRVRSRGLGRMQRADIVGRKIVGLVKRPRPELWPVFGSSLGLAFAALFPRVADWAMAGMVGQRTR